jgi:hypothetical protein
VLFEIDGAADKNLDTCCIPGFELDITSLVCDAYPVPSGGCPRSKYLVADFKSSTKTEVQAAMNNLACICCDCILKAQFTPNNRKTLRSSSATPSLVGSVILFGSSTAVHKR